MGGYSWNRWNRRLRVPEKEMSMGTDIHLYVERKRAASGISQLFAWECVPPPERDLARWPLTDKEKNDKAGLWPWWGPGGCMRAYPCDGPRDDGCLGARCPVCDGHQRYMCWYRNRNYRVFSVLAGIRNEAGIVPIAEVRGCPVDASLFVRDHHDWEHSATWLSLAEVITYPWDKQIFRCKGLLPLIRGAINTSPITTYKDWKKNRGEPDTWIPHDHGGRRGSVVVSPKEADTLLRSPKARRAVAGTKVIEVAVAWEISAGESCSDFRAFVEELVEPMLGEEYLQLKRVLADAIEGGPGLGAVAVLRHREHVARLNAELYNMASEIRFVFGFDS